MPMTST